MMWDLIALICGLLILSTFVLFVLVTLGEQ